jgi:glycosyltransferase involved in cell wall biosynthesis
MSVNSPPKIWLVIFDPTLKSLDGHSHNYDLAVADGAKELFDRVVIFAHQSFHERAMPGFTLKRISDPPLMRVLRSAVARGAPPTNTAALPNSAAASMPRPIQRLWKTLRARGLASSLKRALRQLEIAPSDRIHILVQQADLYEIAGVDAFRAHHRGKQVTFHLVLRHDPEITRANQEQVDVFRARLLRLACAMTPIVRFHTDSEAIAQAYHALTAGKMQVANLPIPISRKAAPRVRSRTQEPANLVRISVLGSSRMERGFGTLEMLIPRFPAYFGPAKVHLAVQINRQSLDPNVLGVIRWLDAHSRLEQDNGPVVELLEGPVSEDVYFSWLARADVLIAPYISKKYVCSTSGVFVEALYCGIPSVVMQGTWAAGVIKDASLRGLEIGEVADSVAAIPERVGALAARLPYYGANVRLYLEDWKRKYSASIAELLLAGGASSIG